MELQFLTEEKIKAHLRLDDDVWMADYEAIEVYAQSAEVAALDFIGMPLDEVIDKYGKVPVNIVLACLFRVADNYTHRDPNGGTGSPVPSAQFQDILKPYIKPETI